MCDRVDDPTVLDDELLWRRIPPDGRWVTKEGDQIRASSMAFTDRHTGEVSVFRAAMTTQADVLRDHPDFGLAEVSAGVVRAQGAIVAADPLDDSHPASLAHAVFCYPSGAKSKASRIARSATLIVAPAGLER